MKFDSYMGGFIVTKSRIVFFALLIGALSTGNSFAATNPWDIKLPFKSAIIHYDVKNPEQGVETLYIRDNGKNTAKVTKTKGKIMFIKISTDTLQITDPDWIVTVDMKKKSAMKITNPAKVMSQEYEKLSADEQATVRSNIEKIGKNFGMRMEAEIQKAGAKILGYTCDLVNVLGVTIYNISETPIMLKTKGSILGIKMESEATKIEENVDIPDSMFRVPEGIEVDYDKKADDLNKEMAKTMIDFLKDPEAAEKTERAVEHVEQASENEEGQRQESNQQNEETYDDPETSDDPEEQEEGNKTEEMINKGMDVLRGLF